MTEQYCDPTQGNCPTEDAAPVVVANPKPVPVSKLPGPSILAGALSIVSGLLFGVGVYIDQTTTKALVEVGNTVALADYYKSATST